LRLITSSISLVAGLLSLHTKTALS
jgi:hypothetical protein